VAGYIKSHIKF